VGEGENYIPVTGTHSVRGDLREVWLSPHQPGRIVLTVYAGSKPIAVVIPIDELRRRLDQIEARH
jgi:hypothetical protein